MSLLRQYMEFTRTTAVYPSAGSGHVWELMYLALGLNGESGEVAEKVKKLFRDGTYDVENMVKELGDVLWYWARLCDALHLDPETVLIMNRDKLIDRQNRDALKGSGDNR